MGNEKKVYILLQTRYEDEALLSICILHSVVVTENVASRGTEASLIQIIRQLAIAAFAAHAREVDTSIAEPCAFVFHWLRAHRAVIRFASHIW